MSACAGASTPHSNHPSAIWALWLGALCACPGPAADKLPCDVAQLVSQKCLSCHGAPLTSSAPMPLLTRADFAATSMLDPQASVAQRSLVRMKQVAAPMPPANAPPMDEVEVAAFEKWVNEGLPAGTCATDPDGGLPVDAGPGPLTCLSGQHEPRPTTTAPMGGDGMAPGYACISCHRGQNFDGQNPFGALGMTPPYFVMGTVYGAPNEEDLCVSTVLPDAGVVVEIRDSTGALVFTAPVLQSGNFYIGQFDAGVSLPYTARVVRGALSRVMTTPQTNGDCNTCHTPLGRESAPGRIQAP